MSANESHDFASGKNASVTLRCNWSLRHDLVADVLANKRQWPHGVAYSPPQARSAAIRPADGSAYIAYGQTCVYEDALVTINYSTEVKDLVSESIEPIAEFVKQDHKRFRWGSKTGDPLLENEAPGKLTRSLSIVRTMYEVPPPLPAVLLTGVGKTNDAQYQSQLLGLTFAPETLLFTPAGITRTITSNGSDGFTVVLKFMYNPNTWNKFWRAKSRAYEQIFDVESNDPHKNNPTTNFQALLY